jgi:hypothetical protein
MRLSPIESPQISPPFRRSGAAGSKKARHQFRRRRAFLFVLLLLQWQVEAQGSRQYVWFTLG